MAEISASQLAEWRRFMAREPFGEAAIDMRIGHILAVLVNAITGQRTRAAHYVPRWQSARDAPAQSWQSMFRVFQDWKRAHHRQD